MFKAVPHHHTQLSPRSGIREKAASKRARAVAAFAALPQSVLHDILARVSGADAARAMVRLRCSIWNRSIAFADFEIPKHTRVCCLLPGEVGKQGSTENQVRLPWEMRHQMTQCLAMLHVRVPAARSRRRCGPCRTFSWCSTWPPRRPSRQPNPAAARRSGGGARQVRRRGC